MNRNPNGALLFVLVLVLVAVSAGHLAPAADQPAALELKTNAIRHWNFSDVDKDASMWSAMYIASNNKIYVGLSTHADSANLYEFDIETQQMRRLANLSVLLDERGKGIWTNGKIHVQMQELDGYVYFGSFCEDNGPPEFDAATYRGPWWFRVNMATGQVEPLSRINDNWGLIGQCMDKQRRLIYGLAEDGHLYKYHIDEDWTEDLGRVDNWDICRTIFADDLGRIYGSFAPARLWRYDPETDRLLDLQYLRLPVSLESRTMANPMLDRRAQWRIIEWDPQTRSAFGITGGSCLLFQYNVHGSFQGVWTPFNNSEGEIRPLAQLCAPMYRGGDPFDVPSATLAMTLSPLERKIYYLPVIAGDFDYGAVIRGTPETLQSAGDEERLPPLSYLVSYDLESGHVEDIGLLRAEDGRYAYGMGGAETDRHGRIWFVGAFEEPDPQLRARQIGERYPYSMGLGCFDPNNH